MEAAAPPPAATPPPAAPGPRRIDVGTVFGEVFRIYGQNAGLLIGAGLALYLVVAIVAGLAIEASFFLGLLLFSILGVLAITLYTGFVVKLVEDVRDGRRDSSAGELLESVTGVLAPLAANGILRGIAIGIGFLLLIVPGLFLMTIWAVTAPAIVVERAGVIDAFQRSWDLVRPQFWMVFAVIVIAALATYAVTYLLGAIGAGIGDFVGYLIFQAIAGAITAPVSALVSAILFFDLGGGQAAAAPAAAAPPPAPPPTAA